MIGNLYMMMGQMLGGQLPPMSHGCDSHRSKRDLEERVSNMEKKSVNWPAQSMSGISIQNNNHNTNTLISR